MPELTREEKIQILKILPKDLQNLMDSEDTGAVLLYFGQKYNLNNEQVRMLSKTVGDVIFGALSLTSLSQEINTQITPDMRIALSLAQELNVELFFPVMESLKQVPAIANTVLTGQPIPATRPIAPAPPSIVPMPISPKPFLPPPMPMAKPTQPTLPSKPDQYREPAEPVSGPIKPKIGPEPVPTLRPIIPPSIVTLRPLEKIEAPKSQATPPAPQTAPQMPAPPSMPQPIKVPTPIPTQQPAPIKIPIVPPSAPAPAASKPLTFTKPILKPDSYREPVEFAPLPVPPRLPTEEMAHPMEKSQISSLKSQIPQVPAKQFIASPAEPSIDLEEPASDIVDLRQDKGRF